VCGVCVCRVCVCVCVVCVCRVCVVCVCGVCVCMKAVWNNNNNNLYLVYYFVLIQCPISPPPDHPSRSLFGNRRACQTNEEAYINAFATNCRNPRATGDCLLFWSL